MFTQGPTIAILLLGALGIVGAFTFFPSCEGLESPASILLGVHPWRVNCLAFSPDGKLLAVGGGFPDQGGEVQLWDVPTGTARVTLRGHHGPVYALAFTPNGRTLATFSFDRMVKLWDVASGRERASLTLAPETSSLPIAFSPVSQALASVAYEPGVVRLWHLAPDPEHRLDAGSGPFVFGAHGGGLTLWSVAAGPRDGQEIKLLALKGDTEDWPTAKIWDKRTEQQPLILKNHGNRVAALAFSPDGQTLASASYDESVKLWEVATGREQATLQGHTHQVNAVACSQREVLGLGQS
jgi:WD40 repeat protein